MGSRKISTSHTRNKYLFIMNKVFLINSIYITSWLIVCKPLGMAWNSTPRKSSSIQKLNPIQSCPRNSAKNLSTLIFSRTSNILQYFGPRAHLPSGNCHSIIFPCLTSNLTTNIPTTFLTDSWSPDPASAEENISLRLVVFVSTSGLSLILFGN